MHSLGGVPTLCVMRKCTVLNIYRLFIVSRPYGAYSARRGHLSPSSRCVSGLHTKTWSQVQTNNAPRKHSSLRVTAPRYPLYVLTTLERVRPFALARFSLSTLIILIWMRLMAPAAPDSLGLDEVAWSTNQSSARGIQCVTLEQLVWTGVLKGSTSTTWVVEYFSEFWKSSCTTYIYFATYTNKCHDQT